VPLRPGGPPAAVPKNGFSGGLRPTRIDGSDDRRGCLGRKHDASHQLMRQRVEHLRESHWQGLPQKERGRCGGERAQSHTLPVVTGLGLTLRVLSNSRHLGLNTLRRARLRTKGTSPVMHVERGLQLDRCGGQARLFALHLVGPVTGARHGLCQGGKNPQGQHKRKHEHVQQVHRPVSAGEQLHGEKA